MDIDVFVQNVDILSKKMGSNTTTACDESGAGRTLITNLRTKGTIPSVERVQRLASYLGVTTSDLLGETPAVAGAPLSLEARRVAEAYAAAGEKEKAIVRAALEL